MRYAVVWSENEGPVYAGSLELGAHCIVLAGRGGYARECRRKILYEELAEARVERTKVLRLGGRPTLVLEDRTGGRVRIASVESTGVLHELLDRVAVERGKAAA
jgi:hypothetical protein